MTYTVLPRILPIRRGFLMPELICTVPVPKTPQELEQAVEQYITTDISGTELICQWLAIRDASLDQDLYVPADSDQVAGGDSY